MYKEYFFKFWLLKEQPKCPQGSQFDFSFEFLPPKLQCERELFLRLAQIQADAIFKEAILESMNRTAGPYYANHFSQLFKEFFHRASSKMFPRNHNVLWIFPRCFKYQKNSKQIWRIHVKSFVFSYSKYILNKVHKWESSSHCIALNL